ncbi:MAG: DinB family protein [Anaerolineae bacterium]|nr:DinB family protein [Anaerolineae bacterium]
MGLMTKVRSTHIYMMKRSCATLGNILANVTQEEATTLRDLSDGENGWSVLEVVCHLADADAIFYQRAVMMLEQVFPSLPVFDHEAMVFQNHYNEQVLTEVYARLEQSRLRFIEFFTNLTEEEWNRAGSHPEKGHFTMTDAVMQVSSHELNHIEQITRILRQKI